MQIDILKALADTSRLALLKALSKRGQCACVLPDIVGKSQPTVSAHLRVLRKAGLVDMRKDGTRRIYSLSPLGKRVLDQINGW